MRIDQMNATIERYCIYCSYHAPVWLYDEDHECSHSKNLEAVMIIGAAVAILSAITYLWWY